MITLSTYLRDENFRYIDYIKDIIESNISKIEYIYETKYVPNIDYLGSISIEEIGKIDFEKKYENDIGQSPLLIKQIDSYIYGDPYFVEKFEKCIYKNETKKFSDPYYLCKKKLINKYTNYIEKYKILSNENLDVCSVCLEKHQYYEYIYFKCNHYICDSCFKLLDFKNNLNLCPLCRSTINVCPYNDKYAILCVGMNKKLNSNQKNILVSLIYFPEFKNRKNTNYVNISQNENCKKKMKFMENIFELLDLKYIIIFQDHNMILDWIKSIKINFSMNNNFILE